MNLEFLVSTPTQMGIALDNEVSRYYTKLESKFKRKLSRRLLSLVQYTGAVFGGVAVGHMLHKSGLSPDHKNVQETDMACWIGYSVAVLEHYVNLANLIYPNCFPKKLKVNGEATELDKIEFGYKNLYNLPLRLPLFLGGTALLAKAGYEFTKSIASGEALSQEFASELDFGLSLFGFASSLYLNNTDPRLLKGQSALNRVYEWGKEKVSSLARQPVPVRNGICKEIVEEN